MCFLFVEEDSVNDGVVREKMFFENPLYFADSKLERIPMFFYSIMYYLKMMVLPAPLVYYYGYDQIEIVGWSNPICMGWSFVCFFRSIVCYQKNSEKGNVGIWFSLFHVWSWWWS